MAAGFRSDNGATGGIFFFFQRFYDLLGRSEYTFRTCQLVRAGAKNVGWELDSYA